MKHITTWLTVLLILTTCKAADVITPPYKILVKPAYYASNQDSGVVTLDGDLMRYHVQIREIGGTWFTMWDYDDTYPMLPSIDDTLVFSHAGENLVDQTTYEIRVRQWYPDTVFARPDSGYFHVGGYSDFTVSLPYTIDWNPAPADTVELELASPMIIIIRE